MKDELLAAKDREIALLRAAAVMDADAFSLLKIRHEVAMPALRPPERDMIKVRVYFHPFLLAKTVFETHFIFFLTLWLTKIIPVKVWHFAARGNCAGAKCQTLTGMVFASQNVRKIIKMRFKNPLC